MQIKIEMRNVYGETKAYPVCTAAKLFADIAGTKTLTRHTLRSVLALGYSVETVGHAGRVYRPGTSVDATDLAVVR
jgi:hypothetical protein